MAFGQDRHKWALAQGVDDDQISEPRDAATSYRKSQGSLSIVNQNKASDVEGIDLTAVTERPLSGQGRNLQNDAAMIMQLLWNVRCSMLCEICWRL
jgi:hypothetical protein